MVLRYTEEQFAALTGKAPPAKDSSSGLVKNAKGTPTDAYRSNVAGWREFSGGKRYYLKSLWEINYAHTLEFFKKQRNHPLIEWEYEPSTFTFPKEKYKTGPFAFKPDFLLHLKGGHTVWREVKGWMNNSSKKKIARFKKHYPEETLQIVDGTWFKTTGKQLRPLIVNWESLPR